MSFNEMLGNSILGWKEDLATDAEFASSKSLDELDKALKKSPTAFELGVGIYVSMAVEIVQRATLQAGKAGVAEQVHKDSKALANFLNLNLKINKKSLPGPVVAALDKVQKDITKDRAVS